MPIRLIITIVLLVLCTVLAGFNIENKCDINYIIGKFEDVPVFITAMFAFAAGIIVMVPFTFRRKIIVKIPEKKKKEKSAKNEADSAAAETAPRKKPLFFFSRKKKEPEVPRREDAVAAPNDDTNIG